MADAELATLVAYIGANLDGIKAGLVQAEGLLKRSADKMLAIGGELVKIGTPIMAGLALASKAAMDFEDALTDVAVRGQVTGDALDELRDQMLKMGKDARVGATNATRGMKELVAGGMSVKQALGALPAVIALSRAELIDMGDAADWVTDTMAQFGLQADKASMAADIVARAAGASSASITDMFAALANVGGIAANFGLDLNETAAILGTFANQGIKGAEAGTQLKSMLTQLNSEAGRKALSDLGVDMYNASGKIRPLSDVLADLKIKLDGMSDKDRTAAIQRLAGSYGQLGLTALLASGGFGAMAAEMEKATGLQELAEAKANTLSGRFDQLKNNLVDLGVKVMGPINDQFIAPLVTRLSDAVSAVGEWVDKNPELVQTLVGIAGSILPVGIGILAFAGVVKVAAAGVGALLSPLVLLLGLLAVAGPTAFANMGKEFEAGAQSLRTAADSLKNGDVGGVIRGIGDAFLHAAGGLLQFPYEIAKKVGNVLGIDVAAGIQAFKTGVIDQIPVLIEGLGKKISEGFDTVRKIVSDAVAPIAKVFSDIGVAIAGGLKAAYDFLGDMIARIKEFLGMGGGEFVKDKDAAASFGEWAKNRGGQSSAGGGNRAVGGRVNMNTGYVVGERGPELFVPDQSGRIVPKLAMGGGGYGNVTLNAYGVSDPVRLVDMIDREMQRRNRK